MTPQNGVARIEDAGLPHGRLRLAQTTGTVQGQSKIAPNPRVIWPKLHRGLEDFYRLDKALLPSQGDAQIAVCGNILRIGRDRLRELLGRLLQLSLLQKTETLFVQSRGRISTRRLRKHARRDPLNKDKKRMSF